jgi:hypothetical protein
MKRCLLLLALAACTGHTSARRALEIRDERQARLIAAHPVRAPAPAVSPVRR